MKPTSISRRHLLKIGSAALAAPFLRSDEAFANVPSGIAKRVVVFHHPQGTSLSRWAPVGSGSAFTLPHITAPFEHLRDRISFVTGLDNIQANWHPVGNDHVRADNTVFTGVPYFSPEGQLTAGGPSIEEVISHRIGGSTPFRRLDFIIGGAVRNGVTPCRRFFAGPFDPISGFNDPHAALLRIFGDGTLSEAEQWAIRSRRSGVLDAVLSNFAHHRGTLPVHQRDRLDNHLARVEELDARITQGVGSCVSPSIATPTSYDPSYDDNVTAPLMANLAVAALACDYTRVATIEFRNGHNHAFPWLTGVNGGQPIVGAGWDNWHAMVHADFVEGMQHVYRWYMQELADLLDKMAAETDVDGDNLLDTSLVLYMPEFNSGRHTDKALPALLAGCVPTAGQYFDFMGPNREAFLAHSAWGLDSEANTNQLFVSMLNAVGEPDTEFGNWPAGTPSGGLPGVF